MRLAPMALINLVVLLSRINRNPNVSLILLSEINVPPLVASCFGSEEVQAFDLAAVAIIYWNLEATVAHLVFK
jgi:hypothetical protein